MGKKGWVILGAAILLGLAPVLWCEEAVAELQEGSYWYAVDNITEVQKGARIIVWVVLPAEWHGQVTKVSSITPTPVAVLEDNATGNRIIEWMVEPEPRLADPETPPVHQFFHYDIELEEKPLHFEVDPAAVGPYDKSDPQYLKYTAQEMWIQTDGKILDLAREIIGQERNPWLQAGLIYDWLLENLTFVPGGGEYRDAVSTLTELTGDCGQFSVMFTALCRSIGIPARTVTSTWLDGGAHVFAEFHLPDYGWIPVDIALGQMLLPDGGGMNPEEVAAFMKTRGVPLGDPRWFFGNLGDSRIITAVGNNISFESPTLGRTMTFQRMQPGGIEATPAAVIIEGIDSAFVQGGFFVFDQEVPDDDTAHSLVHQRLASAFFKEGLYDIVEDSCRKTLAQSGGSVQAWMNIGKVHMHKGEYYKAEAAFKRAINGQAVKRNEKMDALIWTHNYLGNCYDLLGHRDMAVVEYQKVVDLGNNYRGAVDYARKYLKRPFDQSPEADHQ
jgi:hypothetical protein